MLRMDRARAANPRFVFTAKLWQRFTHDALSTMRAGLCRERAYAPASMFFAREQTRRGAPAIPFFFPSDEETVAYSPLC